MDNLLYIFVIVFCVTNTNSLYTEGPNRILDGLNATENQFPYMISLQQTNGLFTPTRGHKCGGVLVTLQHALTAAYCTLERRNGQMLPINVDDYRVFAGSVFLTNDSTINHVRRLANTTVYPRYNSTNNHYVDNIAVIILSTPFLRNTVTPVSVRDIGNAGVLCNITGWGLNNTRLLYGRIETINELYCGSFHGSSLPNMTCGRYEFNASSGGIYRPYAGCPGDEGGPLVCQGGLVGLIIDTRGCTSIPSFPPQWYIRVSSYTSWINHIIALPLPPPPTLAPTTVPPATSPPPTSPPLTSPPPTSPPAPTPTPSAASTFQPGIAVLALIAVFQIITGTIMN